MISYDMVGLFTGLPPSSLIDVVHQALLKDTTLSNRTNLTCNQICELLHLCLDNTYFSYNGQLYQQCHGCPLGSPVSPIVSNLYMEQFKHLALSTYSYTGLQSWHRYVDDTFVVLLSDENDQEIHINAEAPNIKFTQVNISDNRLSFWDCLVTIDTDRTLSVTVTDQC